LRHVCLRISFVHKYVGLTQEFVLVFYLSKVFA
jgi:hypothetical protein